MFETLTPWFLPLGLLLASVLCGWVVDQVARRWLLRLAERSRLNFYHVLLHSLRGVAWLWVMLLGARLAAGSAPIAPGISETVARVIAVLWILSLTLTTARFLSGMLVAHAARLPITNGSTIVRNLINATTLVLGGLVALQTQGVEITPILTALGVGGLAVALALQETLANFFAGLHILAAQQIRPGDYVVLDNALEGRVADIGWRNTAIRTLADTTVIIPNSTLAGSVVVNQSLPVQAQNLTIELQFSYDDDLARIEQVLLDEAGAFMATHPGCEAAPGMPKVLYTAFGDSGIDTSLIVRVRDKDAWFLVRHELIKRLHVRMGRENIHMPFPTSAVVLGRKHA